MVPLRFTRENMEDGVTFDLLSLLLPPTLLHLSSSLTAVSDSISVIRKVTDASSVLSLLMLSPPQCLAFHVCTRRGRKLPEQLVIQISYMLF